MGGKLCLGILFSGEGPGYWIRKQCGEGPIPNGGKFAQYTRIAVFAAGTGYLENRRHELVDAPLLNGADAAGRPHCSAHNSEA